MEHKAQQLAGRRTTESRLRRLHEACLEITRSQETCDVADKTADAAATMLGAAAATVIVTEHGESIGAGSGGPPATLAALRAWAEEAVADQAAQGGATAGWQLYLSADETLPESAPGIARSLRAAFPETAILAVPIAGGEEEEPEGMLAACTDGSAGFTHVDRRNVRTLAQFAAAALTATRRLTEARREARQNAVLAEIGQLVTSSTEIDEVYDRFAALARELLPFDRIAIAAVDVPAKTMTTSYTAGVAVPEWAPGEVHPLYEPAISMVIEPRTGIFMDEEFMTAVAADYPELQALLKAGLRSTIACPLFARDEVIGFLAMNSRSPNAYSSEDLDLAGRIASHIGGAVASVQLQATLQREAEERATLAEIGRLVSSSLEPTETFETLASHIRDLVSFDRFVVARADVITETVTFDYETGLPLEGTSGADRPSLRESVIGLAIDRGGAVRVGGSEAEAVAAARPVFDAAFRAGIRSTLIAPLYSRGEVVGALALSSRDPNAYTDKDLALVERIATQVGGAIANLQLHAALQNEARERVRRLQEVDALRLQFLRMITHEFRTPLASLRISRDLLAETPLDQVDARVRERLLANMGRGVDRLDQLVSDLLDLAIAQAGMLTIDKDLVDPPALLEEAMEIVAPLAEQRNQTLKLKIEPSVPVLSVDRARIGQALLNLLSNAQKYSRDGARIDVSATREDRFVRIRVTGDGPRIPESDWPHLFEPFYRGSGEVTRRSEGRGLGLSIAKAFVELHGGEIGFESIPDRGPSFYFTLPIEEEDGSPIPPSPAPSRVPTTPDPSHIPGHRLHTQPPSEPP